MSAYEEGVDAYSLNIAMEANPYGYDDYRRDEWEAGWLCNFTWEGVEVDDDYTY